MLYLLPCNSSNIVRYRWQLEKSGQHVLKLEGKEYFSSLVKELIKPGGRGHMFCTALPHSECFQNF